MKTSDDMRSTDTIETIIKKALSPIRCKVVLTDYDTKLGFRAFPENQEPVRLFEDEPLASLQSGDKLFQLLRAARRRLKRRGFHLADWPYDPK